MCERKQNSRMPYLSRIVCITLRPVYSPCGWYLCISVCPFITCQFVCLSSSARKTLQLLYFIVKEYLIIYIILSLYEVGFLRYLLLAIFHPYSISVLKSSLDRAYHKSIKTIVTQTTTTTTIGTALVKRKPSPTIVSNSATFNFRQNF